LYIFLKEFRVLSSSGKIVNISILAIRNRNKEMSLRYRFSSKTPDGPHFGPMIKIMALYISYGAHSLYQG
jgi:hypothetical protein